MLSSETLQIAERIIDRFGFPIFVALVALLFFWQMFVFMKATIQKKDADFLAHVDSTTKAMADYVARRDEQVSRIIENHNNAFRENSNALERLSDSIEMRINRDMRREKAEQKSENGRK